MFISHHSCIKTQTTSSHLFNYAVRIYFIKAQHKEWSLNFENTHTTFDNQYVSQNGSYLFCAIRYSQTSNIFGQYIQAFYLLCVFFHLQSRIDRSCSIEQYAAHPRRNFIAQCSRTCEAGSLWRAIVARVQEHKQAIHVPMQFVFVMRMNLQLQIHTCNE